MKKQTLDVSNISTEGCRALAAAVILDAIRSYAICLVREKERDFEYQSQSAVEKEKYSCERFFKSDTFLLYAGGVDLNISGQEIIRRVKRDPYKYARRLKEKEKRSWRDSQGR